MQITDRQVCELSERLMNGIHRNNAIMLANVVRFLLESNEKEIRREFGTFGIELLEELLEETEN